MLSSNINRRIDIENVTAMLPSKNGWIDRKIQDAGMLLSNVNRWSDRKIDVECYC